MGDEDELKQLRERLHEFEIARAELNARLRVLESSDAAQWREVRRLDTQLLAEIRAVRDLLDASRLATSALDSRWKFAGWLAGAIATLVLVLSAAANSLITFIRWLGSLST